MARVLQQNWTTNFSGMSSSDRRSCKFEAYLPDLLVGRKFTLDGDVAADVAEAEAAIARLNVERLLLSIPKH
ncbi:MAG: hypothetical protein M0019_09305 [Actinomycetota bacterium]|nr:hypothetical protein [Actinomycetota bacterium]